MGILARWSALGALALGSSVALPQQLVPKASASTSARLPLGDRTLRIPMPEGWGTEINAMSFPVVFVGQDQGDKPRATLSVMVLADAPSSVRLELAPGSVARQTFDFERVQDLEDRGAEDVAPVDVAVPAASAARVFGARGIRYKVNGLNHLVTTYLAECRGKTLFMQSIAHEQTPAGERAALEGLVKGIACE